MRLEGNPSIGSFPDRFAFLRFPLIFLVVWIHADNRDIWTHQGMGILQIQSEFAKWIRFFWSQGVARVAVPLFFAISGYLFFLDFDGSLASLLRKWKSRFGTLVIPYVAWSLLLLVLVSLFKGINPWDQGTWYVFNKVFGITLNTYVFQFWFLRDLILFVILAPLWNVCLRTMPVATLLLLGFWNLVFPSYFPLPASVGAFYFYFGALLASRNWQGSPLDQNPLLWLLAYGVLAVLDSLDRGNPWSRSLHDVAMFVGCGAFLVLAGILNRYQSDKLSRLFLWLAPSSFFLYAAHEPLVRYTRLALSRWAQSFLDSSGFVLYVVPPLLITALCLALYFLVVRKFAWMRLVFTGGR